MLLPEIDVCACVCVFCWMDPAVVWGDRLGWALFHKQICSHTLSSLVGCARWLCLSTQSLEMSLLRSDVYVR